MHLGSKLSFRAIAELIGILLGAFSMIYVSRIVGPVYLGFGATSAAVIALISRLADGGLTSLASQRLARDDDKVVPLLILTTIPKIVVSFLLIALSLFIINHLKLDSRLKHFLTVSLIMVFFDVCTPQWVFIALGKINISSLIRVGQSAMTAVAVLLLITSPDDWIYWPYVSLFSSISGLIFATGFIFLLKLHKSETPSPVNVNIKTILKCYKEAFHYFKGELSIYIYTSSDRLFLYYFAGPATVGSYEAAYKVINPFYSITAVITPTMFRDLAQSYKHNKIYPIMSKYVFSMSVLTIPLGFFLLYFSNEVIAILYGNRFVDSANYLKILGFVITFGYTSGILVSPFSAWNMSKEFGNSISCGNLLNTILNFSLIPVWGATGAAYATLAAKIIVTVIGYKYMRKVTDYPIVADFMWFGTASLVPLVFLFLLSPLKLPSIILMLVYAITYLLFVSFLFIIRFKVVKEE